MVVDELKLLSDEERSSLVDEIFEQLRIKGKNIMPPVRSLWLREQYSHELPLCKILLQYEHDEEGGGSQKTRVYINEKFGRPEHAQFLKDKDASGYVAHYMVSKEEGFNSLGLEAITVTPTGHGLSSYSIPITDKDRENFDVLLQYVKDQLESAPEPKEK
jgi:hypothetical protein